MKLFVIFNLMIIRSLVSAKFLSFFLVGIYSASPE
jgi:hypothetical protein